MRTKGKRTLTVPVSNVANIWQQYVSVVRPGTIRMQSMENPASYMPDEAAVAEIRRHIDMYNAERPGIYRHCTLVAWLAMSVYGVVVGTVVYGALQMSDGTSLLGAIPQYYL